MLKTFRVLLPFLFLLLCWCIASYSFGSILVPYPWEVTPYFGHMLFQLDVWLQIGATIWRGFAGISLAAILAYLLGIPCGLYRPLMDFFSPLVAVAQGLPPIVWISLLLVWVRVGSAVPLIVVFASVFPVLFIAIAQGTASLDRRLFQMAKVFRVPKKQILLNIILPGLQRPALSAFSFALGTTWKVTATAEFLGSATGVGAKIYRSFRLLDMTALFAWTAVIAIIGLLLDVCLIKQLRQRAESE